MKVHHSNPHRLLASLHELLHMCPVLHLASGCCRTSCTRKVALPAHLWPHTLHQHDVPPPRTYSNCKQSTLAEAGSGPAFSLHALAPADRLNPARLSLQHGHLLGTYVETSSPQCLVLAAGLALCRLPSCRTQYTAEGLLQETWQALVMWSTTVLTLPNTHEGGGGPLCPNLASATLSPFAYVLL